MRDESNSQCNNPVGKDNTSTRLVAQLKEILYPLPKSDALKQFIAYLLSCDINKHFVYWLLKTIDGISIEDHLKLDITVSELGLTKTIKRGAKATRVNVQHISKEDMLQQIQELPQNAKKEEVLALYYVIEKEFDKAIFSVNSAFELSDQDLMKEIRFCEKFVARKIFEHKIYEHIYRQEFKEAIAKITVVGHSLFRTHYDLWVLLIGFISLILKNKDFLFCLSQLRKKYTLDPYPCEIIGRILMEQQKYCNASLYFRKAEKLYEEYWRSSGLPEDYVNWKIRECASEMKALHEQSLGMWEWKLRNLTKANIHFEQSVIEFKNVGADAYLTFLLSKYYIKEIDQEISRIDQYSTLETLASHYLTFLSQIFDVLKEKGLLPIDVNFSADISVENPVVSIVVFKLFYLLYLLTRVCYKNYYKHLSNELAKLFSDKTISQKNKCTLNITSKINFFRVLCSKKNFTEGISALDFLEHVLTHDASVYCKEMSNVDKELLLAEIKKNLLLVGAPLSIDAISEQIAGIDEKLDSIVNKLDAPKMGTQQEISGFKAKVEEKKIRILTNVNKNGYYCAKIVERSIIEEKLQKMKKCNYFLWFDERSADIYIYGNEIKLSATLILFLAALIKKKKKVAFYREIYESIYPNKKYTDGTYERHILHRYYVDLCCIKKGILNKYLYNKKRTKVCLGFNCSGYWFDPRNKRILFIKKPVLLSNMQDDKKDNQSTQV